MKSKIAIAGHPVHPMLVTVPIGLFVAALVADLVYVAQDRDKMWYDIAFWAGNGAVVTALIAALAGFGDYFTVARHTEAKTMATVHMVLNLVVVGMFAIAAVLMADEGALDGGNLGAVIALHAVAVGLLTISGWIGGEIVFRSHIGMIPDDGVSAAQEESRHVAPGHHVAHR